MSACGQHHSMTMFLLELVDEVLFSVLEPRLIHKAPAGFIEGKRFLTGHKAPCVIPHDEIKLRIVLSVDHRASHVAAPDSRLIRLFYQQRFVSSKPCRDRNMGLLRRLASRRRLLLLAGVRLSRAGRLVRGRLSFLVGEIFACKQAPT